MNDLDTLISGSLWSAWNILSSFVHGVTSFFNAFIVMLQWETIFLNSKHVIGIWSIFLFHQVDQWNHFEFCATAEAKFIDFIWYGPYAIVYRPYDMDHMFESKTHLVLGVYLRHILLNCKRHNQLALIIFTKSAYWYPIYLMMIKPRLGGNCGQHAVVRKEVYYWAKINKSRSNLV